MSMPGMRGGRASVRTGRAARAGLALLGGVALGGLALGGLALGVDALGGASPERPASARAAERTGAAIQQFERDGLRVRMALERQGRDQGRDQGQTWNAGDAITPGARVGLRFAVGEAGDAGQPLSGLFPMAWLVRRDPDAEGPDAEGPGAAAAADRAACKQQIRELLQGRLAREAAVNLNQYYLVTLDDNNSLSVIDPQVESSKTKTVGMISLPSKGVDFVLAPDRETVFVSLARGGLVAAANLRTMRASHIQVGGQPRRVALQPDGRLVWVGDAAGAHGTAPAPARVTAIDVAKRAVRARIEVGPGPHELAFRADSRHAYVISPNASALHVIDTVDMRRVAEVDVGPDAIAVAASAHGRQVHVALAHGDIVVVDDDSLAPVRTIRLDATLAHYALSPDGRWGFALDRAHDRLMIIDTASNRAVHRVSTHRAPDRVDFTESFAYVRHADSERYLLVDLSTLGQQGEPQVADVVMGRAPPARGRDALTAPTLAILPEGSGALLLNPADRSVYHFMEGMLAPMGSYRLYPWPARGLLLVDRALHEIDAGVYQTSFQAPGPGAYTVPFLVPTSPQIYDCSFTIEVEAPAGQKAGPPLAVDALFTAQTFAPGARAALEVRLSAPSTGAPLDGLDDVLVLAFRGSTWQWRGPARALGDGRYRVDVRFPRAGKYVVMIQVPSQGVGFGDLPWHIAVVGEP